ncbi:MAG: hypothetical protein KAH32_09100, partial [Chlamydiia bacterium]|nr:hypothetical protein [Chlamydiia bacterium]
KKYLLVVLFAVFMIGGLFAQPGHGGDNNGGDHELPIDGGVITLVVAGVAYGLKKSYKHNA